MGAIQICWNFELTEQEVMKRNGSIHSSTFNLNFWRLVLVWVSRFMHEDTELLNKESGNTRHKLQSVAYVRASHTTLTLV